MLGGGLCYDRRVRRHADERRISSKGARLFSAFAFLTPILLACPILPGRAAIPYFTNLDTACAFARSNSRSVILYTGNAVNCAGQSPRGMG